MNNDYFYKDIDVKIIVRRTVSFIAASVVGEGPRVNVILRKN